MKRCIKFWLTFCTDGPLRVWSDVRICVLQVLTACLKSFAHGEQSYFYRNAAEREKYYISSSHLKLIRCLTPIRVSAVIYTQTCSLGAQCSMHGAGMIVHSQCC